MKLTSLKGRCFLAGILATCTLFFCLFAYLWQGRTRFEYYADYVEGPGGLPQGILPLTSQQVSTRPAHYRFEIQGRKLRRVVHAASGGAAKPTGTFNHFQRTPIQEFIYSDTGALSKTVLKRSNGVRLFCYAWDENYTRIHLENFQGTPYTLSASFASIDYSIFDGGNRASDGSREKATIRAFKITRDEKGRIVRKEFMSQWNGETPTPDTDGIFGIQYTLDELGRVRELSYLGENGGPCTNKVGIAGIRYEQDAYGNIVQTAYFGKDGNLILNEEGFAIQKGTVDSRGYIVQWAYYDQHEQPCLFRRFAKTKRTHDERGNLIERANFGLDGLPCEGGDTGSAKVVMKYDRWGNEIECAPYDLEGKPALEDWAKWTQRYDAEGNLIEKAFYGADGKLCLWTPNAGGVAKWKSKYDRYRNEIERTFYGVDDQPCLHSNGIAKWAEKYDERGNRLEVAYYGLDGQLCVNQTKGYAKKAARYDARNNAIEETYYGTDGKPWANKQGIARWTAQYDQKGNLLERVFYGLDGQPLQKKN